MSSAEFADHIELLTRGLEVYESRRYREAFPILLASLRTHSSCALASYNVLNCLYQLDRLSVAESLLFHLDSLDDEAIARSCPEMDCPIEKYRCDLAYLSFLILSRRHAGWAPAGAFLVRHLQARAAGVESIFDWRNSRKEVATFLAKVSAEKPDVASLIQIVDRL